MLEPHLHALKIGTALLAPCVSHFGTSLPIYTTQSKRFFFFQLGTVPIFNWHHFSPSVLFLGIGEIRKKDGKRNGWMLWMTPSNQAWFDMAGSKRKRRVSSVTIFVTTTQALLSYFSKMPIKIPVSHFLFCK